MRKLWCCDFCNHTEIKNITMIEHEKNCKFNPKLKGCPSCKNDNILDSNCDKDFFSDDRFNCPIWECNNIKLLRKLKLIEINDKSLEM
jgi:hypothetical protein